jgi:methylmalonyl-CoA mutase C-terminal domain/subunit
VDAIGLSILSGAHMHLVPRILELRQKKNMEDVMLFAGGIIPDSDVETLKGMGVAEVFPPGSSLDEIVAFVRQKTNRGVAGKSSKDVTG